MNADCFPFVNATQTLPSRRVGLLALMLLTLAALAGCATQKAAPKPTPPPVVLDYGNGWYHTATGAQSVAQIAERYKREPDMVAQLNKTTPTARPAAGAKVYIPPSNNRDKVRQVLARVRQHPELIPQTPWGEQPSTAAAPTTVAAAPTPQPAPVAVKQARPAEVKVRHNQVVEATHAPQPATEKKHSWLWRMFHRKPKEQAPAQVAATQPVKPVVRTSLRPGQFMWPAQGKVVTRFSEGWSKPHGIEIASTEGAPVVAARPGTVLLAQEFLSYGKLVVIDHGDGYASAYGYNKEVWVKEGAHVVEGQRIGSVGRPSAGSAPKLFFQIRRNATPVDPIRYLN